MMIHPQMYYDNNLKGNNEKELMTAIRGLKQRIGRLKNSIENPDLIRVYMQPRASLQIKLMREYLEMAKRAYREAGGVYTPSKAELKVIDFDGNISEIAKITFSIGGYFNGYETYVIDFGETEVHIEKRHSLKDPELSTENDRIFDKQSFTEGLRDLHIGEWRRGYSTERFGYRVLDGTQWELEFEYQIGHKHFRFSGSNSYPYNFDEFQVLFGIEFL